ncbi:MAG: hypothetical protein M1830_002010 [Pleopsidium flavum]|nr:MAG: hypothetical protein M1830_002010 [Pleopsidium flavum]
MAALIQSFREFLFNRLYNDYHMASERSGLDGLISQENIDAWVRTGKALIEGTDQNSVKLVEAAAGTILLDFDYLEDQLKALARRNGKRWNEVKYLVEGGRFGDLAAKILRDRRNLDKIIPKTGLRRRLYFLRMNRAMTATQLKYFANLESPTVYVLTERGRMLSGHREPLDCGNPLAGLTERAEDSKRFKRLVKEGFFEV